MALATLALGEPECSVFPGEGYTGSVHEVTDGYGNQRCFSLVTPNNAESPMPVLFYFHGMGGNGSNCGRDKAPDTDITWAEYAV